MPKHPGLWRRLRIQVTRAACYRSRTRPRREAGLVVCKGCELGGAQERVPRHPFDEGLLGRPCRKREIGKTLPVRPHLLIGLGMAACERGLRVRYVTAAALVNELAEASDERVLSRMVARYGRLDLLCLDELNYVHLDNRGAELLFQVLTEREERASVAVASNAPFSE